MKLNITARHFKAPAGLTDTVKSAVESLTKFHDGIISTDVILEQTESSKSVEFIVHVSGKTLVAKEGSNEFSKAINGAVDAMVRQIRKLKTKSDKGVHVEVDVE